MPIETIGKNWEFIKKKLKHVELRSLVGFDEKLGGLFWDPGKSQFKVSIILIVMASGRDLLNLLDLLETPTEKRRKFSKSWHNHCPDLSIPSMRVMRITPENNSCLWTILTCP